MAEQMSETSSVSSFNFEIEDKVPYVLTEFHEILHNIFHSLPRRSLNTCARVCRKWNEEAEREKRCRGRQVPVSLLYDNAHNVKDIDGQLGLPIKLLASQPQNAILFCSSNLNDSHVSVPSWSVASTSKYPRAAKQEKVSLVDYLARVLPPACQVVGVACDGIIGGTPDLVTQELEGSTAASCLLLPGMESVDVYSFYADAGLDTTLTELGGPFTPETIAPVINIPREKAASIKLILLFYTEHFVFMDSDLGHTLLKHFGGKVVVAGAYVDTLVPDGPLTNGSENLLMGLAFGGENIKVASIVLRSSVRTQEDALNTIKKLKNTKIPEDNSIAFQFACIGRGNYYYKKHNVESEAFRKVFPTIPIVGIFCNGEVGYEFLPDYSNPEAAKDYTVLNVVDPVENDERNEPFVWDLPEVHHSYTTIFVILHLGPR